VFGPAFCLLLIAAVASHAAGGDVGQAVAVVPGVFVERDGARIPLALNNPVWDTDRITTDAMGKVRILFHDDGAVSLGSNTSLDLIDVVPEGDTPVFKAHVAQGLARFITGKIVEQNPKGFSVSTPEGTAGIRGTIFVLQTGNGRTTIYVANATRDVVMSGVSVPSGFKMTLPGGNPMPMTPEDVSLTRSIAAAPPSSSPQSAPAERTLLAVLDENDPLMPTALANLPVNDLAAPSLTPTRGTIHGALPAPDMPGFTDYGYAWVSWNGSFAFTADLTQGSINNASLQGVGMLKDTAPQGSSAASGFNVSGGSGNITGGSFTVNGFSGSLIVQGDSGTVNSPGTSMNGVIRSSDSTISVDGSYVIGGPNNSDTFTGAFSGTSAP
jgi:hypothetical protein